MMRDWLTDERRSLITGAAVFAFSSALGVIAAAWIVAAFIVGSVRLASWLGGLT